MPSSIITVDNFKTADPHDPIMESMDPSRKGHFMLDLTIYKEYHFRSQNIKRNSRIYVVTKVPKLSFVRRLLEYRTHSLDSEILNI